MEEDHPPFSGFYRTEDAQARRIALAHALRQMADHLEITAMEAARVERHSDDSHGSSFYRPAPPMPTPLRRIGVAIERHEEVGGYWVAKVWNADTENV